MTVGPATPGADGGPTGTVPPALRRYLAELDAASRGLRRRARLDLRARVWTHVAATAGPRPSPAAVEAALAALGPPTGLAADAAAVSPRRADLLPVHLLGASALTLGVGAVAGLVLLWRSADWSRLQAGVATALVVACGAVVPVATTLPPVVAVLVGALAAGPIAAAGYLAVSRATGPGAAPDRAIPPKGEGEPPPTEGVVDDTSAQTSGEPPDSCPVNSKESG